MNPATELQPTGDRLESAPSGARLALRSEDGELQLSLRVSPPRLLAAMGVVIVLLAIASTVAVGALAFFRWPDGSLGYAIVKLFWLDTEYNLPTLYQFVTLAGAGAVMFSIAGQPWIERSADRARWRVLGSIFFFLAVDEVLRIHETVGDTSSLTFGAAGLLLYVPLVMGVGLWWLPLLQRLNARTRLLLLAAAGLYLGGAAGIESISQLHAGVSGKATALYVVLATLEEVFEMAGIALLVYALLEYHRSGEAR